MHICKHEVSNLIFVISKWVTHTKKQRTVKRIAPVLETDKDRVLPTNA